MHRNTNTNAHKYIDMPRHIYTSKPMCIYTCMYIYICTYIYIYIYIYMVTPPTTRRPLQNTVNQRETCFFVGRISAHFRMQNSYRIARQEKRKIPESKCPKIQKCKKNPEMQKSKNQKITKKLNFLQDSVDVKSLGFLDFWIFGFLHFCMFGFWDA